MAEFVVNWFSENYVRVVNQAMDFGLFVDDRCYCAGSGELNVTFINDAIQVEINPQKQHSVYVSGRSREKYPEEILAELDPEKKYVEVGAGLGELVCSLALSHQKPGFVRPIVIDPAPYELMRDMLEFALEIEGLPLKDKIQTFLERAKLILDPEKVVLVNKTLEEALRDGSLVGIGDLVVDFWGYKMNSKRIDMELQRKIDDQEKLLVAPGGTLFQYFVCGIDDRPQALMRYDK